MPGVRRGTSPPPLDGALVQRVLGVMQRRLTSGLSAGAVWDAYRDWFEHLVRAPEKRRALAAAALRDIVQFALYGIRATFEAQERPYIRSGKHDRRFLDEQWRRWPFDLIHESFLLTERWWREATTNVPGVTKHHEGIVSFTTRQVLGALSPASFPLTNPQVLAATVAQRGANIRRGAISFADDWRRLLAGERPAGAEDFVPGEGVALTPGKVVFRNNLVELIQYAPTTPTVYPEPVLLIPAWILRYYILDLSPRDSLVRYLVNHGHTVFVISWKNPTTADRGLGFEDYRTSGLMSVVEVVSAIVRGRQIHAVGYCLGGTLLALAAAAMAGRSDKRLRTVTLLAAQADFTEAGELSTFIDEEQIASLEELMRTQGYLDTRQLVLPVLLLRACEFLWPLLLRQYLLGEREPMTALMAWRTDATRLPPRMYSEYLRRLLLGNELAEGRYKVEGRQVRMADLTVPIFAVGALDDFVAPWRSVYRIHFLTGVDVTFVLTDGDHHSGIIADPDELQRSFTIATSGAGQERIDADTWLDRASAYSGRWWPEWQRWLSRHSSERGDPPPRGQPSAGHVPLCDAPGTYVLQG